MSVMIKGMDLPSGCNTCDILQTDADFEMSCPLLPCCRWRGSAPDYRPEGCRLVEIPTPHGRLIDADKLMQWIEHAYGDKDIVKLVTNDIKRQSTIIEAEVNE